MHKDLISIYLSVCLSIYLLSYVYLIHGQGSRLEMYKVLNT